MIGECLTIKQEKEAGQSGDDRELLERFLTIWRSLVESSTPVFVKKGQVLFYAGHVPCGVYVVTSGTIGLHRDETKGSVGSLAQFQPVGLDLIMAGMTYPESAIAETDAKVYFISKSDLVDLGVRLAQEDR